MRPEGQASVNLARVCQMPTRVVCPTCSAKLRVPAGSADQSFRCPRCKTPVLLREEAEARVKPPTGPPPLTPPRLNEERRREEHDERDEDERDERPRRRDREPSALGESSAAAHSLGIASMVLGVVALPFSMIPCLGMLSLPLSGLGVVVGGVGLIVSIVRKGRGIGFPIAGAAISGLSLVFGLVWILAVGGMTDAPRQATAASRDASGLAARGRATNEPPPAMETLDVKMGEPLTVGDLVITMMSAHAQQMGGQYFGSYRSSRATILRLSIKNTHRGKIAEWAGWQGKSVIEDEHENKFEPLSLRGWKNIPGNGIGDVDPDYKDRIDPGKTMLSGLYFEYMPVTSKKVTVTLPLDGRQIRFHGEKQ